MFGLNKTSPKICDLRGKVAIITGAKQGMGQAHALKLAGVGAKVVLADLTAESCQPVVDEIKKMHGEAISVKCNMAIKADIDNLIAEALKKFGKIDIFVNNAGIFPFKPFLEIQEEDFEKVIDINLKGYFFAIQAAAKAMQKNQPDEKGQRGAIVNIASIAAVKGFLGLSHYCASKGGVVAMSNSLALELAPLGIRINTIEPGAIDTPGASAGNMSEEQREAMLAPIPLKRQGKAEEISNAVLFLA
jgi:NAD(P)-dependent dehydrogenase (short-subunit alcohol dehydrogenase family)